MPRGGIALYRPDHDLINLWLTPPPWVGTGDDFEHLWHAAAVRTLGAA